MFQPNPATPEHLSHFREGTSGYQVIKIVFDEHWDQIRRFARSHRLAMPTEYLGQGEQGVTFKAGKNILKVLTQTFNGYSPEDDLPFAEFFADNRLPGFVKVLGILHLRVNYWRGSFLERAKQRLSGMKNGAQRLRRLTASKEDTYLIWSERVDHAERALEVLADYDGVDYSKMKNAWKKVIKYVGLAERLFGVDHYTDLRGIGQEFGWDDYSAIKNELHSYLSRLLRQHPAFDEVLTSLIQLLQQDILVADIHPANLGIKWNGHRPVLTIFDGILLHLDP